MFHRHFNAPPARLFTRFTEARWLRRWLASDDPALDEVVFEARRGGRIRFLWRGAAGESEMTGTVHKIEPPRLLCHSETFIPDWTGGPAEVVKRFDPEGPGTALSIRITYVSRAARDRLCETPMAEDMERHFVKLDQMLSP